MIKEEKDNTRPKYKTPQCTTEGTERQMFENIDEASSYWKLLWEQSSTNTSTTRVSWLNDVKRGFDKLLPAPPAGNGEENYPHWFTGGKTTLIPKPGEFTSENQRPIACLNTIYKWFTSCLLKPINQHLDRHRLMETEQRGAKSKCSGTTDNLLIDRMVCQDSHNAHKNLSMAWIDVRKAFDSVRHEWLQEIMSLHKFAGWICRTVERLCRSWNTRIVAHTKKGHETSQVIHFNKGLPQGDALCPRLFTMCINPIAWNFKATEGYKLSKPIEGKITHLLYVDDMKVFAASQSKLDRVLKVTKTAMEDIGLIWNEKKCSIAHIKKCVLDSTNHND